MQMRYLAVKQTYQEKVLKELKKNEREENTVIPKVSPKLDAN
jgi:hypothetical protein